MNISNQKNRLPRSGGDLAFPPDNGYNMPKRTERKISHEKEASRPSPRPVPVYRSGPIYLHYLNLKMSRWMETQLLNQRLTLAGRVWLQREGSAERYIMIHSKERKYRLGLLEPGVTAFPCPNMVICLHCPDQVSTSAPSGYLISCNLV